MNKKSFYFGTLVLAALALGSCANEDTATDKTAGKDTPKTGTVFSSETEPATRTSAKYTGSGLDFYWTASDKIWVKDDNGNYNQSADDDISSRIAAVPGSTTTDKAKFWVNGSYTGSTHKVRYTGKNGTKDKVTIKASQTQNTPNDAVHIADDGDFGVADATGSGAYNFTLNHKAAYVTFMPYTAQGVIAGAKLQKIRIYTDNSSDQLAGTFDLADNGTLSNGTTTSNSVELNVNNFSIPSVSTYATNAATMVVNPGTYSNLTIEYTLHDAVTNVTGVITKTYPSVTLDAGKNTPVKADLKVKIYPANDYYMWDAAIGQNYWAGHEWDSADPWQPILDNGEQNNNYPKNNTDARWYSEITGVYNSVTNTYSEAHASRSAADCPNANEAMWYVLKGEPHWDDTELWATMGHLYVGGMWIKKKTKISGFSSTEAPDGKDYRTLPNFGEIKNTTIIQGKPSNLNDYFYLPARGDQYRGRFDSVGHAGYYWTSNGHPNSSDGACGMLLSLSGLSIESNIVRLVGYCLWSSSNEDMYRPF